jgi:DNA-binding IclR family transcriptional regulator
MQDSESEVYETIENSSDELLLKRADDKNFDLKARLNKISDDESDLMQIHRAAKIVTCIASGVNTLSEIGEYCGLSKSSVYRLLKALEKAHFIIYNNFSRKYLIGELITDIAINPEIYYDYLYLCSGKEVEELAQYTGETVLLMVMVGLRQFRVRSIASKYDLRVFEGDRNSRPVFGGAGSLVLLSQLKDQALMLALKSIQWEKINGSVPVSYKSLLTRMKNIRNKGYYITSGERLPGALCIAVRVKNYSLPTALLLLGPVFRMKDKQNDYLDLILKKAKEIESNLAALSNSNNSD